MLIANYGPWSDFASGRTPESYVEDALGGDPAGYDLYAASAAFRRAVCEALPGGVTLAGHHFFGPHDEQDCEWDSRGRAAPRRQAAPHDSMCHTRRNSRPSSRTCSP